MYCSIAKDTDLKTGMIVFLLESYFRIYLHCEEKLAKRVYDPHVKVGKALILDRVCLLFFQGPNVMPAKSFLKCTTPGGNAIFLT